MQRCFTSIFSADVDTTAAFYERLFGMRRHFDSDWFVILTHPDAGGLELGILERANAIVPESARAAPAGFMVSFVVADCEAVWERARELSAELVEPPTDMTYGQRRALLRDPEGTLIDISSPLSTR